LRKGGREGGAGNPRPPNPLKNSHASCKKGVAQSVSPVQDGQGEKVSR